MNAAGVGGAARLPAIDALRALALLPVVVVNYASYATPLGANSLLAPRPADSLAAQLCTMLSVALLESKGICLLAFLFGYSLRLGSRQAARLKRLFGLGLLHGFLLYYGDILGSYALAGSLAWRRRHERARKLLRRGLFWLLLGLMLMVWLSAPGSSASGPALEFERMHLPRPFGEWWQANATLYGIGWALLLFTLPLLHGLVLLGLFASRLRLLTHRRWRPLWARLARWSLPLLALNLVLGFAQVFGGSAAAVALLTPAALLCLPSWAAWLLLRPTMPTLLSQAGRHTLSLYLGSSLLLVIFLSGGGLAWPLGSLGSSLFALAAWLLLAGAGVLAVRGGRQLPLEAWMARRST